MNKYWALVRTVPGAFIRVEIQADNPYNAFQMLKAMYGDQLISSAASLVV
jgi:hypothetical protein